MKRFFSGLILVFAVIILTTTAYARKLTILVNEQDISDKSQSLIVNDRVMVPIRFVSEALGKEVTYNEALKEVVISEGEKKVKLRINSSLIEKSNGEFIISDVKAIAKNDRTYVPVRAVAEAFDLFVGYDFPTNTVTIKNGSQNPAGKYSVNGLTDQVTDAITLTAEAGSNLAPRIKTTKLFVIDPITRKGLVNDISNTMTVKYLPWETSSFKILALVSYDANGNIVAGRGKKVQTKIMPRVQITGPGEGSDNNDYVEITPSINFVAKTVSYTVTDLATNVATTYDDRDPYASWALTLNGGESKSVMVTMNAVDMAGNNYLSNSISFNLTTPKKLSLTGIKAGQKIDRTFNVNVNRNFDVKSTRYYLGNGAGESLLEEKPYGAHIFNPAADLGGSYYLRAEVDLPDGTTMSTDRINVNIIPGSRLLLQGLGPNAVISEPIELKYDSNIDHSAVRYVFYGPENFVVDGILKGKIDFNPAGKKDGQYKVYAEVDTAGGKVKSEAVNVKIHNAKTFGPRPVVQKDEFINVFSKMAVDTFNKYNMAASIQMAQGILETGWGQYVPVDKYTGKLSRNLFGIKGKSSNGSVLSNTWEEYNGVKYRIDDNFRAYNTLNESWNDHNDLLLKKERYQIFRDVMYDPIRGAWAIRRAGYATDSKYPGKLINIIEKQNLRRFDEVDF